MSDDTRTEFYPRGRTVLITAGVMLTLFVVLGYLSFDSSLIRGFAIILIGSVTASAFASPYLLRKEPTLTLDEGGMTLKPTFSRRVYIPWHCLVSARTAIRAKHHLRLEVDWTRLREGDEDPAGESLPHPRSAPLELHGLRRIDLDASVHDVLLILQSYKDRHAS